MAVLTDRASLLRAFYRLTATSATDGALSEHDNTTNEAVYQHLQYGLNDAQQYLIRAGLSDRWVKESSTLTWSGTEATDAGRYVALESDFLRLAGDAGVSALHQPNGRRWGRLIEYRDHLRAGQNRYWLQNERLWITPGSNPPSDLEMDFIFRLPTLADSTTIDFPEDDRPLVIAYAADSAQAEAWLPGGAEMRQNISANLRRRKDQAWSRARRTRRARKLRPSTMFGSHWHAPA